MKPIHFTETVLARAIFIGVFASGILAGAAEPDYSALDRKPVETTAPVGATRGLTRGLTRGVTRGAARSYDGTRGMVTIEESDGVRKELPYVVLPILFKVNSDELLNAESAANLRLLAAKLKEAQFSTAHFVVEGHTSTEGTEEHNVDLSRRRAESILMLLTTEFKVDPSRLSTHGFGPRHPEVTPELTEQDRQRNRRVLVVREK